MPEQNDLFDKYHEPMIVDGPKARPEHPATSHMAAESIIDEGTLGNMQSYALWLLRQYQGATGSELDEFSTRRKGQVHKRLRELERAGLVRVGEMRQCGISGRPAVTWWAVEQEKE